MKCKNEVKHIKTNVSCIVKNDLHIQSDGSSAWQCHNQFFFVHICTCIYCVFEGSYRAPTMLEDAVRNISRIQSMYTGFECFPQPCVRSFY